ncbi:uncharacterized protein LOC115833043 [Nomascus leucogenys]|uniref:uncharacterized protein LOC115833043 n=1 Tax=Nomascus leucogenys TaxID=61853 RepID=UPI00122D9BB3|nr:uncharacterized protein LOC115833043 [Nomascus leucogenys]
MPKQMHPAHDGTTGTPILRTLQSCKLELTGFCLYRHQLRNLRCCLAGKCTAGGAGPLLEAPGLTPHSPLRGPGWSRTATTTTKAKLGTESWKKPSQAFGNLQRNAHIHSTNMASTNVASTNVASTRTPQNRQILPRKAGHVRAVAVSKLGHRQHPRPVHWVEETVLGRSLRRGQGCPLRQNGPPVVCAQQGCGDTRCPLHSSVTCILPMKHFPIKCEKGHFLKYFPYLSPVLLYKGLISSRGGNRAGPSWSWPRVPQPPGPACSLLRGLEIASVSLTASPGASVTSSCCSEAFSAHLCSWHAGFRSGPMVPDTFSHHRPPRPAHGRPGLSEQCV